MRAFDYVRAQDIEHGRQEQQQAHTRFLAGGTTLLDLMKCGVERAQGLIDISHLQGLDRIDVDTRRVHIGALAKK